MISFMNEVATEHAIEQDFHVVHLAIVEVKKEAARRREQAMCLFEPRREEREVVVERVAERCGSECTRVR